jgi:hypothetical protein
MRNSKYSDFPSAPSLAPARRRRGSSGNLEPTVRALAGQDDPVDHPAHYNVGGVEVITAIEAWQLGYLAGNAVKYLARYQYKGKPLEDVKKAAWYVNRLVAQLETTEKKP